MPARKKPRNFRKTDSQRALNIPEGSAVIADPKAGVVSSDDVSPPTVQEAASSLDEVRQLYGDNVNLAGLSLDQLAEYQKRARLFLAADIASYGFTPADLEIVKRQFQTSPLSDLAEQYNVTLDAATMPAVPADATAATDSGPMPAVPEEMAGSPEPQGDSTLAEDVAQNAQEQEAAAYLLNEVGQAREAFAARLQDFVDQYGEDGFAVIQNEIGPELTGNASYRELEEQRNRIERAIKELDTDRSNQQSTQPEEPDAAEVDQPDTEEDVAEATVQQEGQEQTQADAATEDATREAINELNKSSYMDGALGYVPFAPIVKAGYGSVAKPAAKAMFGTETGRKTTAQAVGIPATIAGGILGYNYFFGDDEDDDDGTEAARQELDAHIDAAMRRAMQRGPDRPQATPQQFMPTAPSSLREEFRRYNERYQPQLIQQPPY